MALCSLAVACASCSGDGSLLDPAGPAARRIASLWWLLFAISAVVFLVVVALIFAVFLRSRRATDGSIDRRPVRWGEPFVLVAGVVIPTMILVGAFVLSLRDVDALTAPANQASITVEVTAHDWWWEVSYPENGAVTANEIHIPVGEPVRVVLRSADVIHSFWVPRLQVKSDMIEGRENELLLEADEPGRYRGQCAEFCGLQHANMLFWVEADQPAEFEDWLADQAGDASVTEDEGLDVFLDSTCVGCHAIRGTEADATIGPDLTHLASRETIAAGIRPNTRAELARWIVDPQGVKPGAVMPPTELTGPELEALLDYLEGLE
jgi:cytochrome c oxidase subunit II